MDTPARNPDWSGFRLVFLSFHWFQVFHQFYVRRSMYHKPRDLIPSWNANDQHRCYSRFISSMTVVDPSKSVTDSADELGGIERYFNKGRNIPISGPCLFLQLLKMSRSTCPWEEIPPPASTSGSVGCPSRFWSAGASPYTYVGLLIGGPSYPSSH